MNDVLRSKIIRLAFHHPELREDLLPLLRDNKVAASKTAANRCQLGINFEGYVGLGETLVTKKTQQFDDDDYTIHAATAITTTEMTLATLKTEVLKDPASSRVTWLVDKLACNITEILMEL